MLLRVLIATPHPQHAKQLGELLADQDVHIATLSRRDNLWEALSSGTCDLLVVDENLFAENVMSGIADVRSLPEAPEVVIFSDSEDPAHRAELLAAEAFAVLNPTVTKEEMVKALLTIVARRTEQARQRLIAKQVDKNDKLSDFATSSPAMREFLSLVRKVVDTDSTLLVLGETGVGKEYLSRAIHAESPRCDSPFVPVNCSALSESLLESELFGHVEGAFTGAQRARRGYFELAHKGTLFIDEVGELSPQLQVKLLRVIQERKIQPVGSEEELEVDVRIVAATNLDLALEMEAGRFRPDLYYRLSVVSLEVPPLRNRKDDIPGLIDNHIEHFRISLRRNVTSIHTDALELMVNYHWPGNVRELVNVIERAVLLCESSEIRPHDLPEEVRADRKIRVPARGAQPGPASLPAAPAPDPSAQLYREARREVLEAFELRYLQSLLKRSNGRVQDAARLAGLNTRSLYEKMKKHGLRKEFYKVSEGEPALRR